MAANPRQNGRIAEGGLLDATNLRLLEELQADARLSLAELGRRVSLSSPAVAERLRRLEDEAVITGYRATVDPRALGFTLGVIIRSRPAPRQLAAVAQLARDTPEVVVEQRQDAVQRGPITGTGGLQETRYVAQLGRCGRRERLSGIRQRHSRSLSDGPDDQADTNWACSVRSFAPICMSVTANHQSAALICRLWYYLSQTHIALYARGELPEARISSQGVERRIVEHRAMRPLPARALEPCEGAVRLVQTGVGAGDVEALLDVLLRAGQRLPGFLSLPGHRLHVGEIGEELRPLRRH